MSELKVCDKCGWYDHSYGERCDPLRGDAAKALAAALPGVETTMLGYGFGCLVAGRGLEQHDFCIKFDVGSDGTFKWRDVTCFNHALSQVDAVDLVTSLLRWRDRRDVRRRNDRPAREMVPAPVNLDDLLELAAEVRAGTTDGGVELSGRLGLGVEALVGALDRAREQNAKLQTELEAARGVSVGCPVHYGQIHGGEASELRCGIELLIKNGLPREATKALVTLLDSVDAKDSLAHEEREDMKLRESDLMAEVSYQRQRIADLERRVVAANNRAERDLEAVSVARRARETAEHALKKLQDQVVGAMTDLPSSEVQVPITAECLPQAVDRLESALERFLEAAPEFEGGELLVDPLGEGLAYLRLAAREACLRAGVTWTSRIEQDRRLAVRHGGVG